METIVNKVAESGIITLDLTDFLPGAADIAVFDLAPFLFRGMILREKDYREALKVQDWTPYQGKHTAVCCTADAIIPMWAYMLAATGLQQVAASLHFGTADSLREQLMLQAISRIDLTTYADKRVVIKGCADVSVPAAGYLAITALLQPVVKSLMYGEPCSTVPVYKKR